MESKILSLGAKLRSGSITSAALTEAYLDAIRTVDPRIHAYARVNEEFARQCAAEADKAFARGEDPGPLAGIPMAIKDNMAIKGFETTCCSKILKGYKPTYDSSVWERLRKNGAVLLGKANMDEFAMGSTCETSCYGPTYNPRDTGYVAGGSSGGSAAAVASGTAAYALGSDTGGSIRQPAGFCGIVGLKPTYGAVSRYGLIAYASSLDQIGPLTETVKDAAIVFDAIKGYDPKDQTSRKDTPAASVANALDADIKGKRIGFAKEYFDDLDSVMRGELNKALAHYEKEGARIIEVGLPLLKYAVPVYYILACAEASSNLGRYDGIRYGYRAESYADVNDMVMRTRSEGFGKEVQRRIMLGTYVLSSGYFDAYYKKAQKLRYQLTASFAEIFSKCDALICPVAPRTAFPLQYASDNMIETYLSDIYTVPVNIAGLPAISLPCGTDYKGLPVGMQLIGKQFGEQTILNLAYNFEQSGCAGLPSLDMGVRL